MSTVEKIRTVAMREFSEHGFKSASLRNIVREAGLTTGAFYGYYRSKEELFEALVDDVYNYVMDRISSMLTVSHREQIMKDNVLNFLLDMVRYAYQHLDEFKLLLNCSVGTRYENFIDQIVDLEKGFSDDKRSSIEDKLEHMLITGMYHTFFEVIVHDVALEDAEIYVTRMYEFYRAGFATLR